eukprot:CAMPEP_0170456942 /NCGR_PEP_ID=MMETSP0123-20130129/4400_1 /TAXON_ID=182087 /ORGANISM="Favella ehrenbergii, Strain Fehren 1" /LENGTH=34 /DNA_ID= /DNA_START= /DNA_END= /DNA_ORIENTATION=
MESYQAGVTRSKFLEQESLISAEENLNEADGPYL